MSAELADVYDYQYVDDVAVSGGETLLELVEKIQRRNPAVKRSYLYDFVGRQLGIPGSCVRFHVHGYIETYYREDFSSRIAAVLQEVDANVKADVFSHANGIRVQSTALRRFLQCFGKITPVARRVGLRRSQMTQTCDCATVLLTISQWEEIELLWEKGASKNLRENVTIN